MSLKNNKTVVYWLTCFIICSIGANHSGYAQTFIGKSNVLEVQFIDPELANKSVKPTIRWIYPSESVQAINKDVVNLKLGISSESPVVKVTLIVNNEVVEIFENFSNEQTGYLFDAWLEKTVQLQTGTNDLQLIVQNELGALKHQRIIEVELSPLLRKDHALIFGIDEYDSWDDLQGPVRDANRIARVLEEKGFNIEVVRNPTTFNLLSKLEEYVIKEFQPNDQLFIYFAGQGYFNSSSGEGYIVCKNSVNLPNANTTYISYSAIKSIVNNIPAQHIFMLMDAVKGRGEPLSETLLKLQEQSEDSTRVLNRPQGKTRLGILSGSLAYEQSISHSAGSPLSRAFITYLKKSEQYEQHSREAFLLEFDDADPGPFYIEFGDHNSDMGFNIKRARSDN